MHQLGCQYQTVFESEGGLGQHPYKLFADNLVRRVWSRVKVVCAAENAERIRRLRWTVLWQVDCVATDSSRIQLDADGRVCCDRVCDEEIAGELQRILVTAAAVNRAPCHTANPGSSSSQCRRPCSRGQSSFRHISSSSWDASSPAYFTSYYTYMQSAILGFCLVLNGLVTLCCQFYFLVSRLQIRSSQDIANVTPLNTLAFRRFSISCQFAPILYAVAFVPTNNIKFQCVIWMSSGWQ